MNIKKHLLRKGVRGGEQVKKGGVAGSGKTAARETKRGASRSTSPLANGL